MVFKLVVSVVLEVDCGCVVALGGSEADGTN